MTARAADHGRGGRVAVNVLLEAEVEGRRYVLGSPASAPSVEIVYRDGGELLLPVEDPDEQTAALGALLEASERPGELIELELSDGSRRRFVLRLSLELEGFDYLVVSERRDSERALLLRRGGGSPGLTLVTDAEERARVEARCEAVLREWLAQTPPPGPDPAVTASREVLAEMEALMERFPLDAHTSPAYQELARSARELREELATREGGRRA